MSLHDFVFSKNVSYRMPRHVVFWLVRAILFYLAAWGVYSSMQIENEDTHSAKNMISVQFIVMLVLFDIAYTYIVVYILIPIFFRPKKYLIFWILLTALSGVIFTGKAFATLLITGITVPGNVMYSVLWYSVAQFIDGFGPPAICALFLAIKMSKTWLLNEKQKVMLIQTNANAELEILKAQVNPHFLFNTLHNIYYFILERSSNASVLLSKLSAILNYMICDCGATYVSLEKELAMIQDYLELQQIRYGKRLKLETQIPDSFGDKLVTPLLLIPFVENSFKHGAGKILNGPYILMRIRIIENVLNFTIINNLPLLKKSTDSVSGIGLNNVKKRLDLLYPQNHFLNIEQTMDTFSVNLTIPVFTAQEIEKKKLVYAR